MERHLPPLAVNLQYLVAGFTLQLAVQYLLLWRRRQDQRTALYLGAWSATLAAAMLANVAVFKASAAQLETALLARTVIMFLAVVLVVPTVAAFARQRTPRLGVVVLALLGIIRIALFLFTDLLYAHRVAADGSPVYGRLVALLALPFIGLVVVLLASLAVRWKDVIERTLFMIGIVAGAAIVSTSFVTTDTALAELLTGYWIIPSVLALQAISIRRMALAEAEERTHAAQQATVTAELSRTERRSRLALLSGGMGWYEYHSVSGALTTSAELGEILGVAAGLGPDDLGAALLSVHPDDREIVREAARDAIRSGSTALEFRWLRPDGRTIWVETNARVVDAVGVDRELVGVAKDITDRKLAESDLRHEARHDQLTGLANRGELVVAMDAALGASRVFSLLLIDLDGFKDVNDTLGHPVGDSVLVAVTRRFAANIRSADLLARLGGDEFAIIVADPVGAASRVADHLLASLSDPVEVNGVTMTVRASIGLVESTTHGDDPHTLLRRADAAMYQAKVRGGSWHVFSPADEEATSRRLQLAGQLPRAIDSGEIEVHFQPTVELLSGRCVQLEALVRWRHPEHGQIPPIEFVPLAEQYGLGEPLFRHVLRRALAQCAEWREQHLATAVAVNVWPETLVMPGFVGHVATALTAAELPASALTLELTENAFSGETPELLESLRALRSLGVGLAIDDFGTGYSSLSYLKLLPVDTVKLDQAFTAGLGSGGANDDIVAMTVMLAHRLGLTVVAEGIETPEVLSEVAKLGCDTAQGYWICRPAAGALITEWLRSRVLTAERGQEPM